MRSFECQATLGWIMIFVGQCKGVIFIVSLPEDKVNFFARAGKQIEMQLQNSARIFTGCNAGFQSQAGSAAGKSGAPPRPRNSARSAVRPWIDLLAIRNATRLPNSEL